MVYDQGGHVVCKVAVFINVHILVLMSPPPPLRETEGAVSEGVNSFHERMRLRSRYVCV